MIGFLHPLALLALVAAAIPALLHLLGRRVPPTVVFPAVRYLTATEKEHSRRLRFRNLLLLILRTAVIVFLVLAAARPSIDLGSGDSHPPTALALIVDNSVSSGAISDGARILESIVTAARGVLARVAPGDRLWLVLADGVPRRTTRLEAIEALDGLDPSAGRLDLGAAVRAAALAIRDDPLADGPVVVVSDLQASALSQGDPAVTAVLAWAPNPPPSNRWLDSVHTEPEIWSPDGAVVASVGGSADRPSAIRLRVGGRELDRTLAAPGDRVTLSGELSRDGWVSAVVELDPDELRADDSRELALFRGEPAEVAMAPAVGGFLVDAVAVLSEGGRVLPGNQVSLGRLEQSGVSILLPPSDPAMVGALNRSLRARGVAWQYEELLRGEWQLTDEPGQLSGVEVFRRYRLAGNGAVLATASDEPWLVRDGAVVLLASRMEPEWTRLPVSAAFVPFVDHLLNRIAAQETWISRASPGDVVELPVEATTLLGPANSLVATVPANGRMVAPPETGVYFMSDDSDDTVGALEVNVDPRESRLQIARESQVRASLGEESRVLETTQLYRSMFAGAGRMDLTSLLLGAAIVAALTEFLVASSAGKARDRA